MNAHAPPGRDAASPTQIPAPGWWAVLKRTWAEAQADNLGLISAGVAFYGFLSMVPLLGALVLTYGLVVDPAEAARHVQGLTTMLPQDAARLIGEQLAQVVTTARDKQGLGLLLALGLALYGAMKGAGAVVTALNVVYEEEDRRGFIKNALLQLGITVAAVVVAIVLILAASASHALEDVAGRLSPVAAFAIKLGGWALAAVIAAAAVAALYRFGPCRADAQWKWLTPGSLFATIGLVLATLGFGWYAARFGDYNATYGSLGAVVVLLFWLYLSAYVLLVGAELNAELEHQTGVDTTTGPARPPGGRRARMADEVAPG